MSADPEQAEPGMHPVIAAVLIVGAAIAALVALAITAAVVAVILHFLVYCFTVGWDVLVLDR